MIERAKTMLLVCLTVGLSAGCTNAVEGPPGASSAELGGGDDGGDAIVNRTLARVRRATARYHDPAVAEDDGYHNEEVCITAADLGAPPELGAMGVHFVNPALIDDEIDPLEPEALVYEPRGDGTLHLVGVEYLATGDEPEPFVGEKHFHPFAPPFADWELHAWVWLGNPNGTFADFNPNSTCPEA